VKVLSRASVYGLRALAYIVSKKEESGYVSIGEISRELDISFHFLTKTFQSLTQHGILESYRGPSGGIALARPPGQIFLIDIVKIIEGEDFFETCLLGLPGCGEAKPCPVHDFWKKTKEALKKEFETTSLVDLGAKVSEERLRIRE
jgi:Rrf2 family iron-sulfur cluster assembly transcriptional regulator